MKKNDYINLLNQKKLEQEYQEIIERNTVLVPRHFEAHHGVLGKIVLSKLKMSSNYVCDFFYLSKTTVDISAVFVEIEQPSKLYFGSKNEFSNDFNKALNQVNNWRAWLNNPNNLLSIKETLSPMLSALPASMPFNPKFILVYGRESEIQNNPARMAKISSLKVPGILDIVTFDGLAKQIGAASDCYIAKRTNSHIKILNKDYKDSSIYCWNNCNEFRVHKDLKQKIGNRSSGDKFLHNDKFVLCSKVFAESVSVMTNSESKDCF